MEPRGRVIIVYEPEHVVRLAELAENAPYTILALDREVEYLLEEKGVTFVSASGYRGADRLEGMVFAQRSAAKILGSFEFLSYRGISLGTLFTFSLQEYLSFLLYYLELFRNFSAAHTEGRWIVLPPSNPPPRRGGALARHMHRVIADAALLVAAHAGIKLSELPVQYGETRVAAGRAQFAFARRLYGMYLTLLTGIIRIGTKRNHIRILASDNWHNIEGILGNLPEAHLTLLDRREASRIPFSWMRSHTMQFESIEAHAAGAFRGLRVAARTIVEGWRHAPFPNAVYTYNGVDLTPAIRRTLDTLINEAVPGTLAQIEGAFALIAQADIVLLRASVSVQTHFGALALVAQRLGKPCIEVQHGLEYLGEGSISGNHAARYIATYGPVIDRDLMDAGYERDRLIPTGSPRFDEHVSVRPDPEGKVVCVGPDVYVGAGFDTYDAEAYFKEFFAAMPAGTLLSVRLRKGIRDSFFMSAIEREKGMHAPDFERAGTLRETLNGAKLLVSCYSTAILEGLQCGIPVVFLMLGGFDTRTGMRHFGPYAAQGVLAVARGHEELAVRVRELDTPDTYQRRTRAALDFMAREFRFDGNAAVRLAQAVRDLIRESRG